MGRSRGKGKKLIEDTTEGSGEEEKIPAQKRRGRPLKPFKDDHHHHDQDDKVVEQEEEEEEEDVENKRRKKKQSPVNKEESILVDDMTMSTTTNKASGFRHIGSRRKNKPRRAAEVGVECW